eukprot:Skav211685  [mRNA]  locus=scaffold216:442560:445304:- [translate_table: standard]
MIGRTVHPWDHQRLKLRQRGHQSLKVATKEIDACGKRSQWQKALSLAGAGALGAWCGLGVGLRVALLLLEDLTCQEIQVDSLACGAAISCCGKALQWLRAMQLLDDLVTQQVEVKVSACNAAISSCEKSRFWEKALELFLQINESQNLQPTPGSTDPMVRDDGMTILVETA